MRCMQAPRPRPPRAHRRVWAVLLAGALAFTGDAPGMLHGVIAVTQQEMFVESDAYERFMGRWSRRLAPLLVTFASVREGDSVLDVGSGEGFLLDHLHPSRYLGIDLSEEAVRQGAHRMGEHASLLAAIVTNAH